MGNENQTEQNKKYDKNFLLNLSETKKYISFGILNIAYRIILFIILMACVYKQSSDTTSVSSGGGYYYNHYDDDYKLNNLICSLKGCEKCSSLNGCTSCFPGLKPIYRNNKIIECHNPCQTGAGDKCLTCYKNINKCKSCNTGYTLTSSGKCIP